MEHHLTPIFVDSQPHTAGAAGCVPHAQLAPTGRVLYCTAGTELGMYMIRPLGSRPRYYSAKELIIGYRTLSMCNTRSHYLDMSMATRTLG